MKEFLIKVGIYFGLTLLVNTNVNAQDNPDDLLDQMLAEETIYTSSIFKASRIINGHSVKQPVAKELEFRISHRFGRVDNGAYELFGLDQANIHFSFEYGIVDRLTVGFGRSNYFKTYDGFIKYQVFKQSKGKKNFPLTVTYIASSEYILLKNQIPNFEIHHRLSYMHQVLLARKFNKRLSLQLSPTFIHKNLVETKDDNNDIWALGAGGRYKITQRLSLNAEIFLLDTEETSGGTDYQLPLSVGVDLETGGHVFQIMVTNSQAMREVGFITETTGDWTKGEVHLGFNISRNFDFGGK